LITVACMTCDENMVSVDSTHKVCGECRADFYLENYNVVIE